MQQCWIFQQAEENINARTRDKKWKAKYVEYSFEQSNVSILAGGKSPPLFLLTQQMMKGRKSSIMTVLQKDAALSY